MTLRQWPAAAYAFLALGAGLIAVHFLLPAGSAGQAMVYQSVGLAAFGAAIAVLLYRPVRTLHLWLFTAGLGLFSLGDAIWYLYDFVLVAEVPYPSVADWVYLSGYGAVAAAMVSLLHSRTRPVRSDVLDGAIVLVAASVPVWFALMQPVASDDSMSVAARLVSTLYPAADVVLLIALAQFLVTPGARSFSFRALTLGTAVLLGADILFGVRSLAGTYVAGGWLDACWLIATTLWGAAVLHPSFASLHRQMPLGDVRFTWRRLALLAVAGLATPFLIVAYLPGGRGTDVLVIAAAAAVMTCLVVARMALLFQEHGNAIAALRDADAKRAIAETLRAASDRFPSAARSLECASYEWDVRRDRIQWSEGLAVAFGHDRERADSSSAWFLSHVHPDDRDGVAQRLEAARRGAEQGHSTYRFRTGEETYRDVWDRWVVRRDSRGELHLVVGGLVDVTDRRALEARLQQSEKMEALGRLAGGVAHDFNNLLTAIMGNTELLRFSSPGDERWIEEVDAIGRAAERAAALTAQMLTFSRGRSSTGDVAPLDRTISEMTTMLARLLGTDVELDIDLRGGAAHVACDAGQLEQVVLNLALNARDAMPGGGRLRIESDLVGGFARLVVADTGMGMDEATAARIFEPFFTTKAPGKGTGLGLATVYGVVEQAGGSISVRTGPAEGTSFELRLPLGEAPAPAEPATREHAPHTTARVLLVEDEAAVRAVSARLLERSGYAVVTAATPLEALALFEDEGFRPAAVVTDVVMPHLSGFALAQRIEELRPGTHFLFVTGYVDAERPAGLERHPVLQKPFTATGLADALRAVLDPAGARAA